MLSIHLSLGLPTNKEPRTNDKGWTSILGLGVGLTTPHRKKQTCYEKSIHFITFPNN
jgi:hypothetical protein